MNSSPLKVLTSEILDRIFGELDIEYLPSLDFKSLRLTCHAISDFATQWLFKKTWVFTMSFNDTIEEETEGFPDLVKKYGHLVRQLELDGRAGALYDWDCPFDLLPYLEHMPFLKHLKIHGKGVTYGGYEDSTPELKDLVRQASLHTPPEDRALRILRSLQLELLSDEGGAMCLGELGALVIIPQLQKLDIYRLILIPEDLRLPVGFPGQTAFGLTALKTLNIRISHIDIRSVAKILAFPSALAHLRLGHSKGIYSSFSPSPSVPDEYVEETRTKEDLCRAILQQRHSLETLNITGWGEYPPPDGQVHLIPRLRENKGVFQGWFTGAI